jgi:hypothetical protein
MRPRKAKSPKSAKKSASPAPDAPIELAPDVDPTAALMDIIRAKREAKALKDELAVLKRQHREKKAALESARENLETVIESQEERFPLFERNGVAPATAAATKPVEPVNEIVDEDPLGVNPEPFEPAAEALQLRPSWHESNCPTVPEDERWRYNSIVALGFSIEDNMYKRLVAIEVYKICELERFLALNDATTQDKFSLGELADLDHRLETFERQQLTGDLAETRAQTAEAKLPENMPASKKRDKVAAAVKRVGELDAELEDDAEEDRRRIETGRPARPGGEWPSRATQPRPA